jgi:hypothetical protein
MLVMFAISRFSDLIVDWTTTINYLLHEHCNFEKFNSIEDREKFFSL